MHDNLDVQPLDLEILAEIGAMGDLILAAADPSIGRLTAEAIDRILLSPATSTTAKAGGRLKHDGGAREHDVPRMVDGLSHPSPAASRPRPIPQPQPHGRELITAARARTSTARKHINQTRILIWHTAASVQQSQEQLASTSA